MLDDSSLENSKPVQPDAFGLGLAVTIADNPAEGKRRRISKACDYCRAKKVKCDGQNPCRSCLTHHANCVFTSETKKRPVRRGPLYIEQLEDRVERLEALLRSALPAKDLQDYLDQEGLNEAQSSGISTRPTMGVGRMQEYSSSWPSPSTICDSPADPLDKGIGDETDDEGMDSLSARLGKYSMVGDEKNQYLGGSSNFSLLKQTDYTVEKPYLKSLDSLLYRLEVKLPINPDTDIIRDKNVYPIPQRAACAKYVENFFTHTFLNVTLLDRDLFEKQLRNLWDNTRPLSPPQLALVQVVLALGAKGCEQHEQSLKLFKNAFKFVQTDYYAYDDMETIQALLLMTIYLQLEGRPFLSYHILGIAARIAHSSGFHRSLKTFQILPDDDIEQGRRRCYWQIFCLDKITSLIMGRPSAIQDHDVDIEYPTSFPRKTSYDDPLNTELITVDFCDIIELAKISGECYDRLYSATAIRQNRNRSYLVNVVGELDNKLLAWKARLQSPLFPLSDFRSFIKEFNNSQNNTMGRVGVIDARIRSAIAIHLLYYNCVWCIHRPGLIEMKLHNDGLDDSEIDDSLGASKHIDQNTVSKPNNPRVYASGAICVNAARTALELCLDLNLFGSNGADTIWFAHYSALSSVIVLVINVVQNPWLGTSMADLQLMKKSFVVAKNQERTWRGELIVNLLADVLSIAETAIYKARGMDSADESEPSLERKRNRTPSEQRFNDASNVIQPLMNSVPKTPEEAHSQGWPTSLWTEFSRAFTHPYEAPLDDSFLQPPESFNTATSNQEQILGSRYGDSFYPAGTYMDPNYAWQASVNWLQAPSGLDWNDWSEYLRTYFDESTMVPAAAYANLKQ